MRRAGKIILWLSVALIVFLLLKPWLLELRHLQFYSPWQQSEDDMRRYLKIAFLLPFTLFGTVRGRPVITRFLIVVLTIGLTGLLVGYATRNLDRDNSYPTRAVKELFQNRDDAGEKIILQTESDFSNPPVTVSTILKVKPYSRELQVVHAADTNRIDPAQWKRLY